MNYEEIALLISRQLVGQITEEEQRQLDEWRNESIFNDIVYQHLMDKDLLTREHIRRKLTDSERPLAEVKHRLGIDQQHAMPKFLRWIAVAAVVLIVGGTTLLYAPRFMKSKQQVATISNYQEIRPGTTQATLTRADGKIIALTDEAVLASLKPVSKQRTESQGGETQSINNLSTPRGGEFKVILEDGTEVWLNAETTLQYPESFGPDERRVVITGEAYFKVAKDEGRPFFVVCGGQEVRVYGTEFNINGYTDEPDIRTTLVEGSISLSPLKGNGSELILTPGLQAIFNRSSEKAHVGRVNTYVVTSWRNGMFVFENQTIEQIMHTLSRWYNFNYEFSSQDVAQTVLMGSIPRYSSFAEVAEIFRKLGGIQLRQENNKVIIYSNK